MLYYIDFKAKIDSLCVGGGGGGGGSINTHVISMHNLGFTMNSTQTESVLLLLLYY